MKLLKSRLIKVTIILLFITIGFYSNLFSQNSQNIKVKLSDSINIQIVKAENDEEFMNKLYGEIRKNRRNLELDYLPLLYNYANRALTVGYTKGAMQAFDRIGLQYRYDEVFDSALFYHNKSLNLALQLKDSVQLYYNYNNIGQVYRMQDISVQAIFYFHKALKINEALGDLKPLSRTMNILGAAYMVQENYEQAMHYFQASLDIALKLDDKRTIAYNYGPMGEIFLLQNKNDSAMHYFVKSKKIIVELGRKSGFAVAEHLIGQAHFALNEFEQSEYYFRKALDLHIKEKNARYQAFCYAYLGKIYLIQNKVDSTASYLQKAQKIAHSIHSYENLILINNTLFSLYQSTSEWEKAISSLQLSHAYQDSIISIDNARQLQSLEIEYETSKKEQQIELLTAENKIKSQRNRISYLFVIASLVLLAFGVFILLLRKRQAAYKEADLHQQLLRSQMNPHFIFNVLGSIQNYMRKNEAKQAALYLSQFASLSRSVLEFSSMESISLSQEVEMLRNYIELEKMKSRNQFEFSFKMDDAIESDFIEIPPMMVQVFVENAIKHGLSNIDYKGILSLQILTSHDQVEFILEDNGSGLKQDLENHPGHKSRAMGIFNQRKKLIERKCKKPLEFSLVNLRDLDSSTSGVRVNINLPILNND